VRLSNDPGQCGLCPPDTSIRRWELGLVLDRGYFVPLLVTRTPWLDGLHALDTDMCPALLVSLYPLSFRIVTVGSR
jgi:hypothetical protein